MLTYFIIVISVNDVHPFVLHGCMNSYIKIHLYLYLLLSSTIYKQTYIYRLEDEMWTTSMEEKEKKRKTRKKERFGSLRIGSHYDLVYITN